MTTRIALLVSLLVLLASNALGAGTAPSGDVIISSSTTWSSGTYQLTSLTVNSGAVLTIGGGSTLNVSGAIAVTGGSAIVLQGTNTSAPVNAQWQGAGVTINAGSVQVDQSSSINADGQGYVANAGPGGSPSGSSAGGSYGGLGGSLYTSVSPGPIYGSQTAPTDLGSGGGSRCCDVVAGVGGGAIRLIVSGTLTINGSLSANGASTPNYQTGDQGGGGAGGSLYITTGALAGAGSITANGGGGGEAGGGGGRIAVYYGANSSFTGFATSTATGGASYHANPAGANGTAGFFDTSVANYNLNVYQDFSILPGSTISYNAVTVAAGGVLTIGGGSQVAVANALTVTGTVVVQSANNAAQVNGSWTGAGVTISAANVQVEASGAISADGQGYVANAGPGGSPGGSSDGGSYGGLGGLGNGNTAPGAIYGSSTTPTDLGSGGGSRCCDAVAGAGGGALRLIVSGTLTDNGTISATGGGVNTNYQAGGGAGGSLYITTNTLAGAGSIAANGGGNGESGGGGGRIAVYYATNSGFNLSLVTANGGSGGTAGAVGTVYTLGTLSGVTTLTVSDNVVLPPNSNLTFTTISINNQGTLTLGSATTLTTTALTVTDGGTFNLGSGAILTATDITVSGGGNLNVGGGSNLNVSDTVLVTGNSTVTLQGLYTTLLSGGVGVTLTTSNLQIDAGSAIRADGQGYVGSAGPGGGPIGSSAGGSYGGAGGSGKNANGDVASAATYGSAAAPTDLGSGGGSRCCGSVAGAGGGAIRLLISGTLTNNGIISANGATYTGWQAGGGAGGSVYIATGTLAGAGSISANGGPGGEDGGGGGGRIALYYVSNSNFNANAMTVAGGGPSAAAGLPGTIVFSNTPQFLWLAPTGNVLHGTEHLQWLAEAVDLTSTTVNVAASGPQILTIGSTLSANAGLNWDTTTIPDGRYELRLVFHDANGNDLQELPRTVVINNSVVWHTGTITSNQEWTAAAVQGIDGIVIIPSGVTVTIDPGTIVKALPGAQILVQSGGILNALGGASNPVIFTAFDDGSVGGDSDFTGGQSLATPGQWNGISVQGSGQFNINSYTDIWYGEFAESGTLMASMAWLGSQLYEVTGIVVVPSGMTLTIQPGAIVKFSGNGGITVQPGGHLIAQGTIAQPIYFTSVNDNSVGGAATNSTGTPAPGDWESIIINGGTASFNHVQMLYGGGPVTAPYQLGMIETGSSATITISNSILGQSFWTGIWTGYSGGGDTVTLTNSVVYGVEDRGINAFGGSTVHLVNDTFDNDNLAVMNHGGAEVDMANSIVTNCKGANWGVCVWGDVPAVYSDVWANTPGVANYSGADLAGSNGNISTNPVYVNAALQNYRLNYGSPAIDAANGTVANYPLTDMMGDPRYNDSLVTSKTGVADSNGNFPDMGAFEFVESAVSDIDLTVSSVTGPATAISGSQVQLTWTDTNIGSGTAQGPWHDAIYLVQDPDTNPVEVLAGQVLVAGGVTLGPGDSYTATATVRVPGGIVGNHRWAVKVNALGEVFEGQNTANNTGTSLDVVAIDLPALVVDSPAVNNSFAAAGQSWWYKLDPGATQGVNLNLNLSQSPGGTPGAVQLFIGQGYVPDSQHFDIQQGEWNSPSAGAVIPTTSNQIYYVTAYAQSLRSTPAAFTLAASSIKFSLSAVQPNTVVNSGSATLSFQGGGFTTDGSYQLVGSTGTVYNASFVFVADPTHADVTFAMGGLPTGSYKAQVTENGSTVSLNHALTVTFASGGVSACDILGANESTCQPFQANVEAPEEFRAGFPFEVTLDYENVSGVDQVAPLMQLTATGATLAEMPPQCSGCDSNFPLKYQNTFTSGVVLGINHEGPAGVLPAGGVGSITFLATPTGGDITFNVQGIIPGVPDIIIGYQDDPKGLPAGVDSVGIFADAVAFCNSFLPAFANPAGFLRTCMQFLNNGGYKFSSCGTNGLAGCGYLDGAGLNSLLAADATALSRMGIYEADGTRVQAFEFEKDGFKIFNQRYHQGAFGFGKSHAFDVTAELDNGNPVVYYPDGSARPFNTPSPNQTNQFLAPPGDYGALTIATDGTWEVTESNGFVSHFIADPRSNAASRHLLDYIQDLNGNRISLTYTNDLVTSIVDSVGNTITFTYDALGHILQATDPEGRITTYTYDTLDDAGHSTFLRTVTTASGTLSLAWNEGGPSGVGYFADSCIASYCEPAIGLSSITYPDGSHIYFTYDALGRLASQYRDGSSETVTFAYDSTGTVAVTDAGGNTSHFVPDEYGSLTQFTDPLGAVTQFSYDPEHKLTATLGPQGTSAAMGYDSQGDPAAVRDPLGNQQSLSYTAFDNLQSFTDASGNALGYTYDSHYNLSGTTYPDGSAEQASHDAYGNLTKKINRRGHSIGFSYDAHNLLTAKTYADGSQVTYAYDGHRNLLSATSSAGTTSFTYDSADRLAGVAYPNGKAVQYSYNSGGQRTSMIDSTGFTVNYAYDSVGRLSQLTDGGGAKIVGYTYSPIGRLARKDMGNGTYTTYTDDADGNPLHIINYAANGAILSEFDYTYDVLGRRTGMTTPAGAWTYGYDAAGQVTSVSLPGGSVQYTYDANGNRLNTVTNGSATSYNVNNLNQYTAAGGSAYRYDADGNLIAGGGWSYSYDDENRLIGMASATDTWTYQYDGLGNRLAATHNGTVTQYLTDQSRLGNVVAEFDGNGKLTSHYTYGLDLTSSIPAGGTAAYYSFDAAGNTTQLTNAAGSVVNSYSYLPFGEKLTSVVGVFNPFTYVGRLGVMDEGSGFYLMRNRWYAPSLGRFLQADPLALGSGDANFYRYARNSPVNFVDPLGTETNFDADGFPIPDGNPQDDPEAATKAENNAINVAGQNAAPQYVHVSASMGGGGSVYVNLKNGNVYGSLDVTSGTGASATAGWMEGYGAPITGDDIDGFISGDSYALTASAGPQYSRVYSSGQYADEVGAGTPGVSVSYSYGGQDLNQDVQNAMTYYFNLDYRNQNYMPNSPFPSKRSSQTNSKDPNGKLTTGFGDQGYVPPDAPITYTIYFENQASATAPAEEVVVSDPLDANLDWSTVQLNQIEFNKVTIDVPGGLQSYTGSVNVTTDSNPVSVNASLNSSTGTMTWTMQSVNPVTGGLPANPLAGFLPPNDSTNQGTGYLTFSVKPKSGLANGTTISNQASIVFDANAAIDTNTVTNTTVSVYPTSSVDSLPSSSASTSFPVSWSGTDTGGSGIANYTIYVSTNSGAYSAWLVTTTATSATFTGAAGNTYTFYSMATDNVGLSQQTPGAIQTITVQAVSSTAPTLSVNCAEVIYDGKAHSCTGSATGTGGVTVSGSWSLNPVSETNAGTYSVTGTFSSSDPNYTGGTAGGTLKVDQATPVLALSCSEVTYDGDAHSCTGSATGVGGAAVNGSWNFSPASESAAGSYPVTGTFSSGDPNYVSGGTATGTLTIDVAQAAPVQDFSLPAAPSAITVTAGQPQSVPFTVQPANGFTGTIAFGCSVPATMTEASCSASSVRITGASAVNSTLTVTTAGPHQVAATRSHARGLVAPLGAFLMGFVWFGVPADRRRRLRLLMLALILLLGIGATSCGGSGTTGHTDSGTPAGTYTLVVTATGGSLTHTMNVAVTVK